MDRPARIGFNPALAPLVLPGRYAVRLEVESGEHLTVPLEVRLDPRIEISDADVRAQYDAVVRLTDMESRAMQALDEIEALTERLEELAGQIEEMEGADVSLAEEARQLVEPLESLKAELVRATPEFGYRSSAMLLEKIRLLHSSAGNYAGIEGATAPPTVAQSKWLEQFDEELIGIDRRLGELTEQRLAALNRRLREAGIPHVR